MNPIFSNYDILQANGHSAEKMTISHKEEGQVHSFLLENRSDKPQKIKEVVLYRCPMPFPGQTPFYDEGYSKLSLYAGTVASPRNITKYADAQHYKLPQKDGFFTVYHMIRFFHAQRYTLLGFCSCRRFVGEIRFNEQTLEIALRLENIEIDAGETCALEDFFCGSHEGQAALMAQFASEIQTRHPKLPLMERPTGWCSWQWFGPRVTETDIVNNIHAIQQRLPKLKYIQIDDGYQAAMGDWLSECDSFTDIKQLLLDIQQQGLEPAIWVAPFIAEKKSQLFQQHPDWFVQDEFGQPLPSDRYSFGGWRCGPWYMLDGTHPEARSYLTHVFRTMRQKWRCRYFKLDANMWGAMPFGRRYDKNATCVEAYRQGMQAVIEGVGEDSVILGCNAPMWPSLGVVNSMRVTNDVTRSWRQIKELAHTGFYRGWQNGTLWMNDPDCLLLENNQVRIVAPDGHLFENKTDVTENEFGFHAAYILACGGFVLLGDDVSSISESHLDMIQKILSFQGPAAQFTDDSHRVGQIPTGSGMLLLLFNFDDTVQTIDAALEGAFQTRDFWTGEPLGLYQGQLSLQLPPHSAKVLTCTKV